MMTDQQSAVPAPKTDIRKLAAQMGIGALFGFFAVMGFHSFFGTDYVLVALDTSELASLLLAVLFVLVGLIVLAMSASRKLFMMNQTNPETEENEFETMRPLLFWSSICLFFYAAALALMVLAGLSSPGDQPLFFWGVVGAMLAQSAISWHLWNRYDELYRNVTKDSCAVAFVIAELVLVIWAAATICGYAVSFTPLGVIVAITAIYWAAAIWFTVRRGMT